ncbi:MAG: coproporphyrinogen-III oxidase family protein [Culicoidibacterales bacterium]
MRFTSMMRTYLTRSFKPFTFINQYDNLLEYEQNEQLGLYVHIPFCRTICSFCPYCKETYDPKVAQSYLQALLQEIELVGHMQTGKKQVTSLYFGGGTPALMLQDLGTIIAKLQDYFEIRDGIGVELHPSDVNEHVLTTLKACGVTMISLGIQSFQAESLQALGRTPVDFTRIFQAVRAAEFAVVDVDLIFAIPGQSETTLLADIETAFTLGATQISTYPFIDFTFADNAYKPLPERQKKQMLQAIADYCVQTGRERTSVWTFAKQHTGKYSSVTRDNFLGFGVSATTLLKTQFKVNTFSIPAYIQRIQQGQLPTALTLKFNLRQRAVYYLFWRAYSTEIKQSEFKAFFDIELNQLYGFEMWCAQLLKLVNLENGMYTLTTKGAYYYHLIEQAYTTAYIDKMWHIARTEAFPEKITLK